MDGLRAYAAVGIVLMHVLCNITVRPSANYLTQELIPFFTDFTLLFMIVSGFSLCCGYYRRIREGEITPDAFYRKRYARILPFFALLCLVDLAVSPSMGALYEVFANLTLCFGLLPPDTDIQVIGVGWFLGVVFLFYMLFPFFVFLLHSRRRAWLSLAVSLLFVFALFAYFGSAGRKCMVFCAPFFIIGGMAYLYRQSVAAFGRSRRVLSGLAVVGVTVGFFAVQRLIPPGFPSYLAELSLFTLWLLYAIGSSDMILNNRVVRYISGISMEIYLCHMVFFRVVEKVHLERYIGQQDVLYIVTSLLTLLGAVAFSHVVKYQVLQKVGKRWGW